MDAMYCVLCYQRTRYIASLHVLPLRWGNSLPRFVPASLRFLVHFGRNNFDGTASSLDFGARAFRELVRSHGQGVIDFTITQNFHQPFTFGGGHQPAGGQHSRSYLCTGFIASQPGDIHNGVVFAERIVAIANAAQEWQALGQASLAAIKGAMNLAASASCLAFGTASGGFAPTGAVSATDSFFGFVRTRSWSQIRQFHVLLPLPVP